jgi:enoyl-[acyl-carrier protein] reductase I
MNRLPILRSQLAKHTRQCRHLTVSSEAPRKVALVMGVANQRSIAWATVQSFLNDDFDCILTYQSERYQSTVQKLIQGNPRILGAIPVDVQTDLPRLFEQDLPEMIQDQHKIHAIVHSIAYGNLQGPFLQASWSDYSQAQHISAYSLLETARCALQNTHLLSNDNPSLTALSYLGAVRAVPNYHIMGPAKASLEAIVRALASEQDVLRVNAVSAGPIQTISARSIPGFQRLYRQANHTRQVTVKQVADTIRFLSTYGTGIHGQVIYVDGGYSSRVDLHISGEIDAGE